jgi:hypothetical protein
MPVLIRTKKSAVSLLAGRRWMLRIPGARWKDCPCWLPQPKWAPTQPDLLSVQDRAPPWIWSELDSDLRSTARKKAGRQFKRREESGETEMMLLATYGPRRSQQTFRADPWVRVNVCLLTPLGIGPDGSFFFCRPSNFVPWNARLDLRIPVCSFLPAPACGRHREAGLAFPGLIIAVPGSNGRAQSPRTAFLSPLPGCFC